MESQLKQYAFDHRYLLEVVSRQAQLADPVVIDLDEFYGPLLKAARKGPMMPVDGVFIRDWDPTNRQTHPGFQIGMRLYEVDGIRLVRVRFHYDERCNGWGLDFFAVDRADYLRLYQTALRLRRDSEPPTRAPVLPADQLELLWKNTIGYLEEANLERIKAYGGRARRGILLTGAPGNGKTMACRWIWEACRQRGWEYHLVTPDSYRTARSHNNVENLFSVERRGVIFFDDMDLALRDREKVAETEDQSVFLSAMDGIAVNEGVVFVFTTNCSLDLIDRAFKRPGRLDVVLHFRAPDAGLRRQLMERWHEDIRGGIDVEMAVASTDGYSFAEIEELKNLLVMHFMDSQTWCWTWALKQFEINRNELSARPQRHVGFGNSRTGQRGYVRSNEDDIPF
jgi:hypothetical protein